MSEKEKQLIADGWILDTHSTLFSRKHCYHVVIGKKRYVKVRRKSKGLSA